MIIQGANEPVTLMFQGDLTQLQDFSAVLVSKASLEVMKKWTKDDIQVGEPTETDDGLTVTEISLPLEQDETMLFTFGTAVLQVKWLLEGNVWFADDQEIHVKRSLDETLLVNE